jgi:hypothetical protein
MQTLPQELSREVKIFTLYAFSPVFLNRHEPSERKDRQAEISVSLAKQLGLLSGASRLQQRKERQQRGQKQRWWQEAELSPASQDEVQAKNGEEKVERHDRKVQGLLGWGGGVERCRDGF